ncbi:hypothetical protein PCAU_2539 [Pseudomonas chlororaphis subsp. aurantiaca]|uniref:hypothetical protein n=1 Tax=Pseudomonas chlororaphis TaxID=587753 RepID=UPI000864CAF4|nr:hypothetical protein [Pseudomonas chlororaphis]BAV74748.1 hypothetical protein PCAU_2539 [Pseudomonas chlororaphis subsp. aurantiaca]
MKTDWQQIREMMNTVIDSCEQIETAGFNEEHRSATVKIEGVDYSVQEFLISAWTLPENIRYQIIRERHESGNDLPYVPEAARILVSMAQACAELVGAADTAPAQKAIAGMNHWYKAYAVPHMTAAIRLAKKQSDA